MQTQWWDNRKKIENESESEDLLFEVMECNNYRKSFFKVIFHSCEFNFLKKMLFFLVLFSFSLISYCQSEIASPLHFLNDRERKVIPLDKKKLKRLIIGESIGYGSAMTGAYFLWYKNSISGGFHSFNDSKEWLLMDKFGHFSSSFIIANASIKGYQWTNLDFNKSLLIGSLQSLFFMTSLELFDGFSNGYGFSWTDMGFNVLGVGAYYTNNKFQNIISIQPKYSYRKSEMAQYRPNILGQNFIQQLFKDYNGQTYWLSFRMNFIKIKTDKTYCMPFNISLGYGAQGMTGGHENVSINEQGNLVPDFQRFRQFYLSFDIDLRQIPCKNKTLKKVLSTLNILKFPFPALEFSRGKVFMNWTSYGK